MAALVEFNNFITRVQQNGESIGDLCLDLQLKFKRLAEFGFKVEEKLLGILLFHAILNGAYKETFAFYHIELAYEKIKLADIDFYSLAGEAVRVMTNSGLVVDGVVKRLSDGESNSGLMVDGVAKRIPDRESNSDLMVDGAAIRLPDKFVKLDPLSGKDNLTDDEVDLLFRFTKCPLCLIPRGRANEHYLSECPRLKAQGFIMTYDPSKDEERKKREAKKKRRGKANIHRVHSCREKR